MSHATTLRATNLTADGAGTLQKALEPQLQKLFEDLGKQAAPAPVIPAQAADAG